MAKKPPRGSSKGELREVAAGPRGDVKPLVCFPGYLWYPDPPCKASLPLKLEKTKTVPLSKRHYFCKLHLRPAFSLGHNLPPISPGRDSHAHAQRRGSG